MAWQFPAEDATVLTAGLGELAAQLGARGLADARDPVASVHAVLARFPVPWLLIFDNAADLASVAAFLPPAGPGRAVITSQNPNWPGQPLEVPVLDPDVAAGFLVSRTGDTNRQAAWDLADMLGGLPLALEQAAAYTQATGDTLADYLPLFRQRRAECWPGASLRETPRRWPALGRWPSTASSKPSSREPSGPRLRSREPPRTWRASRVRDGAEPQGQRSRRASGPPLNTSR